MKFSESWLREWVNPKLTRTQLCEQFTMAGLEVEEVVPAAEKFFGVVIGQVAAISKHPEAERLQVCEVDIGTDKPLTIVCGASNVKLHMKVAAALENAALCHTACCVRHAN
jgi:phenylalanyl-tRNA synthetase beta chain